MTPEAHETIVSREMTQQDLLELLDHFELAGCLVWLDGGWGVDALLGEQTRRHGDVDVVVVEQHLPMLVATLKGRGFTAQSGGRDWNFVMADDRGREVDVHVVVLDAEGNGLYGPQDNGECMYPADALTGNGSVSGRPVRCLTADYQVISHTGYELDADDFQDVHALHKRFGVPLPPEYQAADDGSRPSDF